MGTFTHVIFVKGAAQKPYVRSNCIVELVLRRVGTGEQHSFIDRVGGCLTRVGADRREVR
jgi:hypothetical protein